MSTTTTLVKLLVLASCVSLIQADVSLYIPGFDPQPLSASVIGVGSNGDTTYLIQAAAPTGDEDPSDSPAFTLVEGASGAGYTAVLPDAGTVAETCTYIGNGQADCVQSLAGSGLNDEGIFTTTETVQSFAVQGGGGGDNGGNSNSNSGGGPSVTPAPSGSGSGSGSAPSSQTAAPGSGSGSSTGSGAPPAKTGSSATAIKPSFLLFAAVAVLLV